MVDLLKCAVCLVLHYYFLSFFVVLLWIDRVAIYIVLYRIYIAPLTLLLADQRDTGHTAALFFQCVLKINIATCDHSRCTRSGTDTEGNTEQKGI